MFKMNVKATEDGVNGRKARERGWGREHFIAKEEKAESVTIGRRPIHQLNRQKINFLS